MSSYLKVNIARYSRASIMKQVTKLLGVSTHFKISPKVRKYQRILNITSSTIFLCGTTPPNKLLYIDDKARIL